MVSNTIQCGFESHPGHPPVSVAGETIRDMHPIEVRRTAVSMLASGWSVNATASRLGVSRAAVRDWRDHGVDRPGTWSGLGELPSAEYAALFGYYLGDGCVSEAARTTFLRVSCDRGYPGIIADVDRCIRAVHPHRSVHHVEAPGVVVVQNAWKLWPVVFPQHGRGRKHERALVMADWQREMVERHPGAFLRGLFHSDGSRVRNWATREVAGVRKRYDYPRWQFTNESEDIKQWCGEALDLLGIPWRRSNRKTLSVSTREGVRMLDEHIGPKR
jgi:hypothetical protein